MKSHSYINMDGKAFMYQWALDHGPWELRKLHSWIMRAMKQDIQTTVVLVPKNVFSLAHSHSIIVIDFEGLHAIYQRQMVGVKFHSVWSM